MRTIRIQISERDAFDEEHVLDKPRLDAWMLGDPREAGMSFNLRL